MWSPTLWLSIKPWGFWLGGPIMAVPGPFFHFVKCFLNFFRKILVSSSCGHFPEIVFSSATPLGAAGPTHATPYGPASMVGPSATAKDRVSDRYTPYGKFLLLLATPIWPRIFPKVRPGYPGRVYRIWPIIMYKAGRLIIILSHYNYIIFFYKSQVSALYSQER